MSIFKSIFNELFNPINDDLFIDSSTPASVGCICDQNSKGAKVSGWCSKHHTDWI